MVNQLSVQEDWLLFCPATVISLFSDSYSGSARIPRTQVLPRALSCVNSRTHLTTIANLGYVVRLDPYHTEQMV